MTIVKWQHPYGSRSGNELSAPFKGLLEDFFGSSILKNDYAAFVPAVNVKELGNTYEIELSAPGFNKEDLKIEMQKGVLNIIGEYKKTEENAEKRVFRKEFNYGSFQRSFSISDDINEAGIDACYENGILKITLPKKEDKVDVVKEIRIS